MPLVVPFLLLATAAGRVAAEDASSWWWVRLLDVPVADASALRASGLDEACAEALRNRLRANGVKRDLLDGERATAPLETLADANALYGALADALQLSDRAGAIRCVAGTGDCAWPLPAVRRVCGRAPDAALWTRAFAPPRLAWWGMRALSAFFLPQDRRRRLGLLDGTASPPLARPGDALASLAHTTFDASQLAAYVAQLQSALQAVLPKEARPALPAAGRRLGLWSTQTFPPAVHEKVRTFVRSVPTLKTEAARAAAERAIGAVQRALTQFSTDVYLELPTDKKMLIAAVARKDVDALYRLLAYLKSTGLAKSVRARLAFTRAEAADALAYAAGDDGRFQRVAESYARRVPTATADERAAVIELLRFAQPATRALGVAVEWLQHV